VEGSVVVVRSSRGRGRPVTLDAHIIVMLQMGQKMPSAVDDVISHLQPGMFRFRFGEQMPGFPHRSPSPLKGSRQQR
jgi:hypothetical protein